MKGRIQVSSCRKVSDWAAEEETSEIREKIECWENKEKQICKYKQCMTRRAAAHSSSSISRKSLMDCPVDQDTQNDWIHFPAQLVTFLVERQGKSLSHHLCLSFPTCRNEDNHLICKAHKCHIEEKILLLPARSKIGNMGRDLAVNDILFCKTTSCNQPLCFLFAFPPH